MVKTIGTFTKRFKNDYCTIRADLQEQELSAPIWLGDEDKLDFETYIHGTRGFRYRWLQDTEGFQIKYGRKWFNAYSIDFDFHCQTKE